MSEVLSKAEHERQGHFCSVLVRPDTLPWFMARVERQVELLDERPTMFDVGMRMKWLLLNRGLAATDYLIQQCQAHKGTFTSPVRTYRVPTEAEVLETSTEALKQILEDYQKRSS